MAAIPTILKGDDSGSISITLDSSHVYTGATLAFAYQGVTRTFTNLVAGGTISVVFTHDETKKMRLGAYPVMMELVGSTGGHETVANAEMRIKVTDCIAEVNAGSSFVIQPGAACVPVTDVGDLASRYTMAQLSAKVNQIVRVLAQRSLLAFAVCAMFATASVADVAVQKARLDSLYNDSLVVTNVTGGGGGGSGLATNEVKSLINAEVGGTNTIAHTIAGKVSHLETDPTATEKAQSAIAAAGCVRTNEFGFAEVGSIAVESSIDVGTYVSISSMALHYDYIESTWGNLLFPWSDSYDEDLYHAIATRSQIPTSSDYIAPKGTTNSVDTLLAAARTDSASISYAAINHTNAHFSNEVLAVGLGIGTNEVAQINAILTDMGKSPIGEATTVGALLAALAAAVAWLKRETLKKGLSEQGVPTDTNVASLFTSANTSLMNTIQYGYASDSTFPASVADGTAYRATTALADSQAVTIVAPLPSAATKAVEFMLRFSVATSAASTPTAPTININPPSGASFSRLSISGDAIEISATETGEYEALYQVLPLDPTAATPTYELIGTVRKLAS